jgi:hypothetical protein
VWDEEGKLVAALMNHAIHPTTMPASVVEVSGDNAGAAERAVEREFPGAVAMFLNAGLGDQSPDTGEAGRETWEDMEGIGEKMAATTLQGLKQIVPASDVTMTLYQHEFDMPAPYLRPAWECWGGLNQLFKVLGKNMIRARGELMGLALNDTLILFSPGELAVEVQLEIERAFPGRLVMVAVHSNDLYGYVVTPTDYDTGGYETCMNFYGRDFAPLLVREFKTMIETE